MDHSIIASSTMRDSWNCFKYILLFSRLVLMMNEKIGVGLSVVSAEESRGPQKLEMR